MRIPFSKWSPCGNVTVFLEQPLSAEQRASLCAAVLQPSHLYAEQSGTIDLSVSPPQLTMMGGEFCVNATRAFAALLASRGYLIKATPQQWTGRVAVSGTQVPLNVRVVQHDASHFVSAACLPLSPLPLVDVLAPGVTLVRLPGIVHLVLDMACHPLPCEGPDSILCAAASWRETYNLNAEEASGVIWLAQSGDQPELLSITPVVRVRDTNSVFLETSCGSGSLAAALSRGLQSGCRHIRQPSGENLKIVFEEKTIPWSSATSGGVPQIQWQAWVEGNVELLAEGITYVNCNPSRFGIEAERS